FEASGAAEHARELGDRGAAVLDLLQAVLVQARHALADRHLADRLRGAPFERHRLDRGRYGHHLVQADARPIAAAGAAAAADGLVGLQLDRGVIAAFAQHARGDDRAALARLAE